ncbi:MAG: hypothetical protein NUV59_03080 [Patescibacteria group bacterium]|nr:hypothetical protein [Patescibacteria group bacterium]
MPRPHIIFRLVLAKALFKNGVDFCNTKVDIFSFSQGLIALHDALDNFTGAISNHLGIALPQESKFLATLNLIQDHERKTDPSFSLMNRNELVQLNTVRNNIKHQGITPNITHSKALIGPIVAFFQEYSRRYFSLEWEMISLADLIKDESVRDSLKNIEQLIGDEKFKDALNELAVVKFQVFDESLMQIRLNPRYELSPPSEDTKKIRQSNNIFPHSFDRGWFGDIYDRADFLEKGIDRDMMRQFESLTAKVGVNNAKDWKYVLSHGHQWREPNWTKEICIFCFDFLVDAIIKNQRRDYSVKQKWVTERHKIQALDEIKIYDKDHNLIYTMPKDEERDALLLGRVEGEWEIFDANDRIVSLYDDEDGKKEVMGFFDPGDETKIKVIKTHQYIRNENGDFVLIKEY